jgi:hypothetical protein
MTVASYVTPTQSYVGNGTTTTFVYGFRILNANDLDVTVNGIPQTSGYTVTGINAPGGGSVIFGVAPASGVTVVLSRTTDLTQLLDYQDHDAFPAESHEFALDKLTLIAQDHDYRIQTPAAIGHQTLVMDNNVGIAWRDHPGGVPQITLVMTAANQMNVQSPNHMILNAIGGSIITQSPIVAQHSDGMYLNGPLHLAYLTTASDGLRLGEKDIDAAIRLPDMTYCLWLGDPAAQPYTGITLIGQPAHIKGDLYLSGRLSLPAWPIGAVYGMSPDGNYHTLLGVNQDTFVQLGHTSHPAVTIWPAIVDVRGQIYLGTEKYLTWRSADNTRDERLIGLGVKDACTDLPPEVTDTIYVASPNALVSTSIYGPVCASGGRFHVHEDFTVSGDASVAGNFEVHGPDTHVFGNLLVDGTITGAGGGASGGISPGIITAIGDLIVGSGVGTVQRFGVGASGTVLTSDPAAPLRVAWVLPSTATLENDAVTNAKLRDSAGTSVIGRASGATGDPADIQATADGQILRRSVGALAFGAIDLGWTTVAGLLPEAKGGTNATTFASARTNLSVYSKAEVDAKITGGGGGLPVLTYTQPLQGQDALGASRDLLRLFGEDLYLNEGLGRAVIWREESTGDPALLMVHHTETAGGDQAIVWIQGGPTNSATPTAFSGVRIGLGNKGLWWIGSENDGLLRVAHGINRQAILTFDDEHNSAGVTGDFIVPGAFQNPDVLQRTIFTARGDILVATAAGTAFALPAGPTGYLLTADPAVPAGLRWASPATASGAILRSIVNAKGDLIVGTAPDTVDRLPGSATNGFVLTYDSTTATGLKWAAGGAGGGAPTAAQYVLLASDAALPNAGLLAAGAGLSLAGAQLSVAAGGITNAMLRDGVATSVVGRASGTSGDVADIQATSDGHVFRRLSGTLGWSYVTNAMLTWGPNATGVFGRASATAGLSDQIQATADTQVLRRSAGTLGFGTIDLATYTTGALTTARGGVPTGGTNGQVLAKTADTDYAVAWIPAPAGGGGDGLTLPLANNTPLTWLDSTGAVTNAVTLLSSNILALRPGPTGSSVQILPGNSAAVATIGLATINNSTAAGVNNAFVRAQIPAASTGYAAVQTTRGTENYAIGIASGTTDLVFATALDLTTGRFLTANASGVNIPGTLTVTGALTMPNDTVTNAKLANMTAPAFKGRTTTGTGDPEDLTATQATAMLNLFTGALRGLVPSGGTGTTFLRGDGTWQVPAGGGGGVTFPLDNNVPVSWKDTPGGATVNALNFFTDNVFYCGPTTYPTVIRGTAVTVQSATTFDSTVTVTGALTMPNDTVTNVKLANMATQTFKGRTTAATGDPEDLTATQATAMLNLFTTTSVKGLAPGSTGGTTNFLRADGTWAVPPGTGGGGIADTIINAKGDLIVGASPDTPAILTAGADFRYLRSNSAATNGLDWITSSSLVVDSFTAKGEIIVGTSANAAQWLTVGTNGQVLTADSAETGGVKWADAGVRVWANINAAGDWVGSTFGIGTTAKQATGVYRITFAQAFPTANSYVATTATQGAAATSTQTVNKVNAAYLEVNNRSIGTTPALVDGAFFIIVCGVMA